MSTNGRRTSELWSEGEQEWAAELIARAEKLLAQARRAEPYLRELIAATRGTTDDADARAFVARWRLTIRSAFATIVATLELEQNRLPPEWGVVMSEDALDGERAAAASAWAARIGLHDLLYRARAERHRDALGAATRERGRAGIRELIAQGLLVAATEAEAEQSEIRLRIDEGNRVYRLSATDAPIVPQRDLPLPLFKRWVIGQVRRYVMDELVPGWRDAERLEERALHVVSLDALSLDALSLEVAQGARTAMSESALALTAKIEQLADPLTLELVRLRAEGATHEEAAAALGITHDSARKRSSRLIRAARALSQTAGKG